MKIADFFIVITLTAQLAEKQQKYKLHSSIYITLIASTTNLKKRKLLFVDGNFLLDLKLTSSAKYIVDV